jgi:hypothetical protein
MIGYKHRIPPERVQCLKPSLSGSPFINPRLMRDIIFPLEYPRADTICDPSARIAREHVQGIAFLNATRERSQMLKLI